MTHHSSSPADHVWNAIDADKRRDRLIRRISVVAWSITVFLVLLLGVMVGAQVIQLTKAARVGFLPWITVLGAAMPFIIVLGILSVLIGTLSTIGVFLRLRTTSLHEIQLRLAALEQMIGSQSERPTT